MESRGEENGTSECYSRYQVPGARCQKFGTLRFLSDKNTLPILWHRAPGTGHLSQTRFVFHVPRRKTSAPATAKVEKAIIIAT